MESAAGGSRFITAYMVLSAVWEHREPVLTVSHAPILRLLPAPCSCSCACCLSLLLLQAHPGQLRVSHHPW